jgi:hypothetical protein
MPRVAITQSSCEAGVAADIARVIGQELALDRELGRSEEAKISSVTDLSSTQISLTNQALMTTSEAAASTPVATAPRAALAELRDRHATRRGVRNPTLKLMVGKD